MDRLRVFLSVLCVFISATAWSAISPVSDARENGR